jgi:hypothetical protein
MSKTYAPLNIETLEAAVVALAHARIRGHVSARDVVLRVDPKLEETARTLVRPRFQNYPTILVEVATGMRGGWALRHTGTGGYEIRVMVRE